MKYIMLLALTCVVAGSGWALELVRDSQPLAEIVISTNAAPMVRAAAGELQKYVQKMSGEELPIVTSPTGKTPVYVGASAHTAALGISLDDVRHDGFKIIVTEAFMALLGVDEKRATIPRGYTDISASTRERMQREWEAFTGHAWAYPRILRDPRLFSADFDFHMYDAAGTLYAVYDFLELLGMRWYLPLEDIGQVIPELASIAIRPMERKKEPEFASRYFPLVGLSSNPQEFLWYKHLKMGGVFDMYPAHSAAAVTKLQQDEKPGMIAHLNGRPILCGRETYLPRLASPELRAELAAYLVKLGDAFPELPDVPVGQPDGWIAMDEEDVAAGWQRKERGVAGEFSDYHWDFVLDVARRVREARPDARFNTLSYGRAKEPPGNMAELPGYISVYLCQNSDQQHLREYADFERRREWAAKAPNSDFYIYDYYRPSFIPTIFTELMARNFRDMPARIKGLYVELLPVAGGPGRKHGLRMGYPGVGHLMLYLHGKYTWDRRLDLPAVLAEYYEKFYGPAAAEMREFFEYAEEVWMRPESRQITAVSGFLKPGDVPKYFEILSRAKAQAGDSIHGRRIALIEDDLQPLHRLFSGLDRTGPYVRVRNMHRLADMPPIDGDLTKAFWAEHHPREWVWMRENRTGSGVTNNRTKVAFRWLPASSLLIGIECFEDHMPQRVANTAVTAQNDMTIYLDDNIEVYLDTPEGYRAKIVVNPNGAVLSRCESPDIADVPDAWRADAVAVQRFADRWTVEIRVNGLGKLPTKSFPWGVNVCRQRLAGDVRELYAISPTGGRFATPNKMGNLWER